MLFLDGVYIDGPNGHPMQFRRVKAPTRGELAQLTHTIAHRVARYLERQGLLEHDTGNIYLTPEASESGDRNHGCSDFVHVLFLICIGIGFVSAVEMQMQCQSPFQEGHSPDNTLLIKYVN